MNAILKKDDLKANFQFYKQKNEKIKTLKQSLIEKMPWRKAVQIPE